MESTVRFKAYITHPHPVYTPHDCSAGDVAHFTQLDSVVR